MCGRVYYRKKPVVIEAQIWNGDNIEDINSWTGGMTYWDADEQVLKIKTLEGIMNASIDDYIIRGVHGEYYACKPDIFKETYEESSKISFASALELLNLGFRMRRKSWKEGYWISKRNKEDTSAWLGSSEYLAFEDERGGRYLYIPSNEDLMSDDWEPLMK